MDHSTTTTPQPPRLPGLATTALTSVLLLEDHIPPPWQESASTQLPSVLLIHTSLAFLASIFRIHPSYAFPLALTGLIIVGSPPTLTLLGTQGISAATGAHALSASFLLSTFTLLFLISAPIDLLWLWRHLSSDGGKDTTFLVLLSTAASFFLKPLTLLTLAQILRNQGVLEPVGASAFADAQSIGAAAAAWGQQYRANNSLGSNGGWLGGGGARDTPSYQHQQQQQQRGGYQPAPSTTPYPRPRPISTFSTSTAGGGGAGGGADRYADGYQIYGDSDDEEQQPRGGVAIPGSGHGQQPTEADAMPISTSFARQAGFTVQQQQQPQQ
ncbi:hypothetical protein V8E36_004744 [Tilletia maclaganii]